MSQKVRAKMRVHEIVDQGVQGRYHDSYNPETPMENVPVKIVKAMPVSDTDGIPENEAFNRATPTGKLELTIINPIAAEFFQVGDEIYLDITKADTDAG